MFAAIQFVIMQTMTSFTPRRLLKSPGIIPHIIPPAIPTSSAKSHTSIGGMTLVGIDRATIRLPIAPIRYCPGAPMLKSPVLKARATESPVIIKGVQLKSILPN